MLAFLGARRAKPNPGRNTPRKPFVPAQALQTRVPHWHPDVPFLVAWSQKAGCTSVLKWFLFQAGLLEDALRYSDSDPGLDIHSYEMQVFKAETGYRRGVQQALQVGLPVLNFLRCPFQRTFSAYVHLSNRFFINFERKGIESMGLRTRQRLLRHVYGDEVSIEYPVSFLDYLGWLEAEWETQDDPHHLPQHSAIYACPGIEHFRLEDFDRVVAELEQRFGLKSSRGKVFGSGHHRPKSPVADRAALRLLERALPLNPSPQFRLPRVTRELLAGTEFEARIQRLYAQDIALYDSLG